MKQIKKSYAKLFLKSWVETFGTIVFLAIFLMVVLGMMSTPLQIAIKLEWIKSNSNLWTHFSVNNVNIDRQFKEEFIFGRKYIDSFENKDKAIVASKAEFEFPELDNYKLKNIEDNSNDHSWFTKEGIHRVNKVVENILNPDKNTTIFSGNVSNELIIETYDKVVESAIDAIFYSEETKILTDVLEENDSGIEVNKVLKLPAIYDLFKIDDRGYNNGGLSRLSNLTNFFGEKILRETNLHTKTKTDYSVFYGFTVVDDDVDGEKSQFRIMNFNGAKEYGNDTVKVGDAILATKDSKKPSPVKQGSDFVEVLINDAYAKEKGLKIGDVIKLKSLNVLENSSTEPDINHIDAKLTGFAYSYANSGVASKSLNGNSVSKKNFAYIYLDNSFFDLWAQKQSKISELNFYKNNGISYSQEIFLNNNKNYDFTSALSSNEKEYKLIQNGNPLFQVASNRRQQAALTKIIMMVIIFSAIGGIIIVLGFIFINFVNKNQINASRRQMGVFKSLGYSASQLSWIFIAKTVISMLLSFIVGYLLSIPFQIDSSRKQFSNIVTFSFDEVYANPVFLLVLALIPFIFGLFAFWTTYRYLKESALNLLSEKKDGKKSNISMYIFTIILFPIFVIWMINRLLLYVLKKNNKGFTYRLQNSFISKSKWKFVIILMLFSFSSFLLLMQFQATPVMKEFSNGIFGYLKDDVSSSNTYKKAKQIISMKNDDSEENILGFNNDSLVEDHANLKIKYINIKNSKPNEVDDVKNNYIINNISLLTNANFNLFQSILNNMNDYDEFIEQFPLPPQIPFEPIYMPILFNFLIPLEGDDLNDSISGLEYISDISNIKNNKEESKKNLTNIIKNIENNLDFKKVNLLFAKAENNKGVDFGIKINDFNKIASMIMAGRDSRNLQDNKIDIDMSGMLSNLFASTMKYDSKEDGIIFTNKVYYSDSELLTLKLPFFISGDDAPSSDDEEDPFSVYAVETKDFEHYSDIRNFWDLSSVSNDDFEKLNINESDIQGEKTFNGIISYRIQKLFNLNKGDYFDALVGENNPIKIKVRVAGINKKDTLKQTIIVDQKLFIDKLGDSELKEMNSHEETRLFNKMYSKKDFINGEINMWDIQESFANMSFSQEFMSIAIGPESAVFASLFGDKLKEIIDNKLLPSDTKLDSDLNLFIDYNIAGKNFQSFKIFKIAMVQFFDEFNKTMVMYIILDVLILTIILIIIMNIIIFESANIIVVMRSLGYKASKVNWTIIGGYVVGTFITFIASFVFTQILWFIIAQVVWTYFKIILFIPLTWDIFLAPFAIIEGVMFIGWLVAMLQIRKKPLTMLIS